MRSTNIIASPSGTGFASPRSVNARPPGTSSVDTTRRVIVPHVVLMVTTSPLAISAGANVKVVQRLLGHATAAMTLDRYGHLLSDDLAGVADALGKAIESTAVPLRYSEAPAKRSRTIKSA